MACRIDERPSLVFTELVSASGTADTSGASVSRNNAMDAFVFAGDCLSVLVKMSENGLPVPPSH